MINSDSKPIINDLEQVKEFILWAKAQKVKSFKLSGIEVELSDFAIYEQLPNLETEVEKESKQVVQTDLFESQKNEETTDEDLYWSSKG